MGQIKHYNNGAWTIYTSGEDLSGYTGTTNTYYIGFNNTDGSLSKVKPNGNLINLEKEFTYEIGDYVESEGGIIYHRYKSGDTQYYLVVDINDLSIQSRWSDVVSTSNAVSLWDGQSNTNLILNQGSTIGAACLCTGSTNGGKTDWYLPSIQELSKIWNNLFEVSRGFDYSLGEQFSTEDYYWSSTESSSSAAITISFVDGAKKISSKSTGSSSPFLSPFDTESVGFTAAGPPPTTLIRVRAVRKFSI